MFRLRASPARLALSSLNIKAEEMSCYSVWGPSSKALLLSHWRGGGSAGLRALVGVCVLLADVIDWAAAALEEDPFCRSDLRREEGPLFLSQISRRGELRGSHLYYLSSFLGNGEPGLEEKLNCAGTAGYLWI